MRTTNKLRKYLGALAVSNALLTVVGNADVTEARFRLLSVERDRVVEVLGTGLNQLSRVANEDSSEIHSGAIGSSNAYRTRIGYLSGLSCYAIFVKKTGGTINPTEATGLLYLAAGSSAWAALPDADNNPAQESSYIYQVKSDEGAVAGQTLIARLQDGRRKLIVYSPEWRPDLEGDIKVESAIPGIDDAAAGAEAAALPIAQRPERVALRPAIRQFEEPRFLELIQAAGLIRAVEAREAFGVDGTGLAVAVLDTGLRTSHVDFAGRVVSQRNFTTDNGGDPENAADGDGHGTNVGGIIVAGADHTGIAPGAGIVPVKVLANTGGGSFAGIEAGLRWVADNREALGITVVNMSLGASGNAPSDNMPGDGIRALIQQLRADRVAVVISAGNDFALVDSQQGMGYPGVIREGISVGAVYDAIEGGFRYSSGAEAFSSAPDQITPFSQRLHPSVGGLMRTDIFAPGAPVTSSGILNDNGESVQHGTSQAAPVTAGVILLAQQLYKRSTGNLPTIDQLEKWMRVSAKPIVDSDPNGQLDNVANTNLTFPRLDALAMLQALKNEVERESLPPMP